MIQQSGPVLSNLFVSWTFTAIQVHFNYPFINNKPEVTALCTLYNLLLYNTGFTQNKVLYIFAHTMKVSGVQHCFGPHWNSLYGQMKHSSKYILCSTKETIRAVFVQIYTFFGGGELSLYVTPNKLLMYPLRSMVSWSGPSKSSKPYKVRSGK